MAADGGIIDGIVIGAAGGAVAGIVVLAFTYIASWLRDALHKDRVHTWLMRNVEKGQKGKEYYSTRMIASHNNLTMDRVRYVCSSDERIYLSVGPQEDMWSLHSKIPRGDPNRDGAH